MDVGGELRKARTARKLSLKDIRDRTKINQQILRSIEENRFDRVPGGLFARGYLRAYAREVRLDPEQLVAEYRAEFEPAEVERSSGDDASPSGIESMVALRDRVFGRHSTESVGEVALASDGARENQSTAGLAIVLLIGALYFGLARSVTSSSTPDDTTPKPTDAAEAVAALPSAAPTTGTLESSKPAPLKLAIQAKADCWVKGSIDGQPAIARVLKAGEHQQFDVHDRAALRIGDPSAFSFTLDGMPGRVLGTDRTAVNLTFDRKSYTSVLAERPR